jgi:hypothetical protein
MLPVLAANSYAFTKTFGLVVVFGGIGVLVNVLIVLIAIQIHGERQQNKAPQLSESDRTHPV